MSAALPPMEVVRLGRVEYDDGLVMQESLASAVLAGNAPDTLLLLEHDPVITLGRGAKAANVLFTPQELSARGVAVHETGRGGDVTWHGPGQLVGYPIVNLGRTRETKDVRKFVRSLEEILLRVCASHSITAERDPANTGVWVGKDKIAAIGVRISKWVSSHGFALNVSPDLSYFDLIVPCGITGRGVTSLAELSRGDVAFDAVQDEIATHAAAVFGREVVARDIDQTTIAVAIRRRVDSVRIERGQGPSRNAEGQRPSTRSARSGGTDVEFLVLRRVPSKGGFRQIVTGRMERGETPAQAAARELQEETGLEVPVRPLGYEHGFALQTQAPARPMLGREVCFLADIPPGGEARLSHEHDEVEWLPLDDAIAAVKHSGHRRALKLAAAAAFR